MLSIIVISLLSSQALLFSPVIAEAPLSLEVITPTSPKVTSPEGESLTRVIPTQQVFLTSVLRNNFDKLQSFVAIIDARNGAGLGVYLAWHSSVLPSKQDTTVSFLWAVPKADDYEIRILIISDFENPQVLSAVHVAEMKVFPTVGDEIDIKKSRRGYNLMERWGGTAGSSPDFCHRS